MIISYVIKLCAHKKTTPCILKAKIVLALVMVLGHNMIQEMETKEKLETKEKILTI